MPQSRAKVTVDERPLQVCLLVLPESMAGPLIGLYEDLNALEWARAYSEAIPPSRPIVAEIVTPGNSLEVTANSLPIRAQKTLSQVDHTDVLVIPSLFMPATGWELGRHSEAVEWIRRMHESGALLCSTCTGIFPLAETGLLDGWEATVHWGMTRQFCSCFPNTRLRIREALVVSGANRDIVTGGASASWHDMLLYVVSRYCSPKLASALAKFLLLNWHPDGQAFCSRFAPSQSHGDGAILAVQRWLETNFAVANPVEETCKLSGLTERTFKRRFTSATSYSPINYIQELRVEKAKALLESGDDSVEAVSWKVGYEDPSYFRNLFKRLTGVTAGEYRKKYRVPVPVRL